MLVLFDIDGTLLETQRAGARAMLAAARDLFGVTFTLDGVEIAGRLDPLIWHDAARLNGIDDPDAHHDVFRRTYAERLTRQLAQEQTALLLPGVRMLVEALVERGVGLGVLTGNYPETGRLKLEAAGLDPAIFLVGVWGNDGASRRDLPPVAMTLHEETTGRPIHGSQVLIIGDTPHDIDCARVNGCHSIAVATGGFDRQELLPHGADMVLDDLNDTATIIAYVESIACGREPAGSTDGGSR